MFTRIAYTDLATHHLPALLLLSSNGEIWLFQQQPEINSELRESMMNGNCALLAKFQFYMKQSEDYIDTESRRSYLMTPGIAWQESVQQHSNDSYIEVCVTWTHTILLHGIHMTGSCNGIEVRILLVQKCAEV
jgi:hypothetical protein